MSLAYGLSSLQDLLAKAERDLARLENAQAAQDEAAGSDALFDFAVALTSFKDWLKEHPNRSFSATAVENYVSASVALSSFRDIANGGKHRVIRKYVPETAEVAASATAMVETALFIPDKETVAPAPKPFRRLKIIRKDGSRHRAVELGHDAVREWRAFMCQHGV